MTPLREVALASSNPGKVKELRALLEPLGVTLITQTELGVGPAPEPHLTFVENALAKARHVARATQRAALADDSGLCVDALDGAPGVHSARYGGEPLSDERNNQALLRALEGVRDRRARFVCVLVLVRQPDDPLPLIAQGEWPGEILEAPRGANGFGYDPLFWVPEEGASSAELPPAVKNRLSHRGRALAALAAQWPR